MSVHWVLIDGGVAVVTGLRNVSTWTGEVTGQRVGRSSTFDVGGFEVGRFLECSCQTPYRYSGRLMRGV